MTSFKICFSNLQIYNAILLTVITMPYIISPEVIYFIPGDFYLLTPFTTHPPHTPCLWQPVCSLYLWIWFCFASVFVLDSTYKWRYTAFVFDVSHLA